MKKYNHGFTILENPTSIEQPLETLSAVQVIFGTAPINLTSDPKSKVNKPILLRSLEEAKSHFGYSNDYENFTLCEAMYVNFEVLKVAPVVFVNVLDPNAHKKTETDVSITITNKIGVIKEEGVLLDSLVLKDSTGATSYVKDTDYVVGFNDEGHVVVSILSSSAITSLKATFDQLDPSSVTTLEIIGGYEESTNTFSGLELTKTIFPSLDVVPNILLAPGYSQLPEVAAVLVAKSYKINGCFNASNVLDLIGKTKEDALTFKEDNYYTDKSSIPCWPKPIIKGKFLNYSTVVAAAYARRNAEDKGISYRSASNMKIPISGMVNDDGKEVFLDQVEANVLNAKGVVTAINMKGWRIWGNNTAMFDADIPLIADPKDRFIPVRRMFDWWGNQFILNFFDSLDGPISYRLIESIVDSENVRSNGYQASGVIAGAKIEFRQVDNPMNEILSGKIQFIQKVGFFTPAEEIINVLEFDPSILATNLTGGE
ncbi:phage tail sheath family protein [Psychrobacillus sp.]|uniref:phage tail sheath family protein n=1 Tax=Psychrobacillus sp. TaxID=1871623 RepID=UPI0028BEA8B8|nr:phage tail sheath family protein [Psychrobacillus sp.]